MDSVLPNPPRQMPVFDARLCEGIATRACEQMRFPTLGLLELFLTNDCNLRCSYCFVGRKRAEHMTADTAIAAFEAMLLRSRGVRDLSILFFGGEPLLRLDTIRECLPCVREMAAQQGQRLTLNMTTNGTLLDEEALAYLARESIKFLLSIDGVGADHDQHRVYADGRGSFDHIAAGLPLMKRYQPWLGSRYTVTPATVGRLAEGGFELHRLGLNQFLIGPAYGLSWSIEDLHELYEQMSRLRSAVQERRDQFPHLRITLFEGPDLSSQATRAGRYRGAWGCGAGRGRLCCAPDGDLYGCSKLLCARDSVGLGLLRLGNVQDHMLDLDARAELCRTNESQRTLCVSCAYADDCCGGCPATNYACSGSPYIPGPIDCAVARIYIELGRGGDFPDLQDITLP